MVHFRILCNATQETFSAKPQTEEELTYASATLILAGLLQTHTRLPRFASYRARLNSFPSRATSLLPSPAELAAAGFFHTGAGDEAVCPACGLGLRDWQSSDEPEACHVAFSNASRRSAAAVEEDEYDDDPSVPSLPCLYLAVRRLLVSELPLARKHLVPVGPVQSVCTLPGVTSSPVGCELVRWISRDNYGGAYASLTQRLRAIARIMAAPPTPQGWPVANARALGHSDDLIVLALWRLQAESVASARGCPSLASLRLDPHATADLLRAILRVQEGLDPRLQEFPPPPAHFHDSDPDSDGGSLSAEDAETAALSRCGRSQLEVPPSPEEEPILDEQEQEGGVDEEEDEEDEPAAGNLSADSSEDAATLDPIRLPRFSQLISWWAAKWPEQEGCKC